MLSTLEVQNTKCIPGVYLIFFLIILRPQRTPTFRGLKKGLYWGIRCLMKKTMLYLNNRLKWVKNIFFGLPLEHKLMPYVCARIFVRISILNPVWFSIPWTSFKSRNIYISELRDSVYLKKKFKNKTIIIKTAKILNWKRG